MATPNDSVGLGLGGPIVAGSMATHHDCWVRVRVRVRFIYS